MSSEGLTTIPEVAQAGDIAGSDPNLFFGGEGFGGSGRCESVGVGGVMVVSGAVKPALGGVLGGFGAVTSDGRLLFAVLILSDDSVRMFAGMGGGLSGALEPLRALILLLDPLLPKIPPKSPSFLATDLADSRSGLTFLGLLSPFDGVKASFSFRPGEMPRRAPPILPLRELKELF